LTRNRDSYSGIRVRRRSARSHPRVR
jgi:hypothetical protein